MKCCLVFLTACSFGCFLRAGDEKIDRSVLLEPAVKLDKVIVNESIAAPLRKEPSYHLKRARFGASAVAEGNYLYIIGGSTSDNVQLHEIERVDIRTGQTETWAKLKIARVFCRSVIHEGKIYVLGGLNTALSDQQGQALGQMDFEDTVEIIDLTTRTVTRGVQMPVPKANFACAVIKDQLYVIGGERLRGNALVDTNSTEIFNFTTQKWEKGINMPTPRQSMAVVISGFIVVAGGHRGLQEVADVEVYIPAEKLWRILPKLHKTIDTQAAAFSDHHLYIFGNEEFIAYDLKTKTSASYPTDYKVARHPTAVAHGGKIYVVGGNLYEGIDHSQDIYVDTSSKFDGPQGGAAKGTKLADNYGALDDIHVFAPVEDR